MTVKNTEVNNGLEAWRALNATCDRNNKGRQRVRMQYLLQTKRPESSAQTTEAVERWESDVTGYEQRFGKVLDEDVKFGVILARAPSQAQSHCHLNSHTRTSYGQVRTMLFECFRAQTDLASGGVVNIERAKVKARERKEREARTKNGKTGVKAKSMGKPRNTLTGSVLTAKRGVT